MIKNFLTDTAKDKISFDRITSISFEASQFKNKNPEKEIINGTIGMFYDEDEKPYVFELIKSIYNSFSIQDISSYGFLYPTNSFTKGVFNLLILNEEYRKNCVCFPCSGGLNAIHHFTHNFIDSSTSIFSLNPYWGPYENILGELGYKIKSININPSPQFFIDENLFFETIKKDENEKIIILLNIPCQNPTGYTPSLSELKNIKDAILKLEKIEKKTLIFFDLVYLNYSKFNINDIFDIFSDLPFFFNFSSSKTLSLYGFRTGAICLYSYDKEDKEIFNEKMAFSARASTGSINNLGYKIIEKFEDNLYLEQIKNNWNFVKERLDNRAKKFIKILEKYDFDYYRYDEGFFISFFHKNFDIQKLTNKLKENGIFFVPQKDSIRVAISSIPLKKIEELESRLKKIL
ncbi:MAG TPA: pyridoxal phosphate-dependent aminotransferase [Exilispira sp.]|nr:pyridoxal phosphate-dependent aminotransferase [Exilispira sp.]